MTEPRLISGADAAAYCGVTPATWSKWVADGIMPKPIAGTRRWDRKAIDLALDKASGIVAPSQVQEQDVDAAFAKWEAENEARKAARLLNPEIGWPKKKRERGHLRNGERASQEKEGSR